MVKFYAESNYFLILDKFLKWVLDFVDSEDIEITQYVAMSN